MKKILVYEKKSDFSREYAVEKASVNESEIIKFQTDIKEKIDVISVYGCFKECVSVSANFLNEKTADLLASLSETRGKKEAVVLLAKNQANVTRVVVFYVNMKKMYKDRPFSMNNPGLIFLKCIVDLSKTTFCCGSKKASDQWFIGNKEKCEKLHPYCSSVFNEKRIKIEEKKVDISNMFQPISLDSSVIYNINYFNGDLSNITFGIDEPHFENISRKDIIYDATKAIRDMLTKYINSDNTQSSYHYASYAATSELSEKVIAVVTTRCKKACNISKDEVSKLLNDFFKRTEALRNEYSDIQTSKLKKIKENMLAEYEFEDEIGPFWDKARLYECWEAITAKIRRLYEGYNAYWDEPLKNFKKLVKKKKKPISERDKKHFDKEDDLETYFTYLAKESEADINKDKSNYSKSKDEVVELFIPKIKERMTEFEKITTQVVKDYEIVCDRDKDGTLKNLRIIKASNDIRLKFKSQCEIITIFQINSQCKNYIVFTRDKEPGEVKVVEYCYSRKTKEVTKLAELTVSNLIITYHPETFTLAGFDNEKCVLYYGQIDELGKWGQQPYSPFSSMKSPPKPVTCLSFYPDDNYRIFMLTEDGTMFQYYIRSKKLEKIEHKVNVDGEIRITSLVPSCKTDEKYEEIQVCDKAKMIFMRSKSVIDCYNTNWTIIYNFKLSPDDRLMGYKIFSNQMDNIILLIKEKGIICNVFTGSIGAKELTIKAEEFSAVPGNPLLDSLYCALYKFNPKDEKKNDLCICFEDFTIDPETEDGYQNKYINYASDLGLTSIFHRVSLKKLNDLEFTLDSGIITSYPKAQFLWVLKTRIPIQITTIEEANMVPLKDGLNQKEEFFKQITESRYLTEAIVNYAHFGIYENILMEINKPLVVVGIVGKQSSGKSYFLNQMFSTIFDVSGTRCTDGIWLSLGKVGDKVVAVFDCEGLFSIRRVEMEEIKLCTTLAAVCDILILNQDLTFSRQLSSLFNKFNKSVGRIEGKKLFKGILLNLVRDVPSDACKDSLSEWESMTRSLFEKKEHTFIEVLFTGRTDCQPIHHYENAIFPAEVRKVCQKISQVIPRWMTGKEFLDSLKLVLSHVYTDDDSNIDSHYFMLLANRQMDSLKSNWLKCEQLKGQKQTAEVTIEGKLYLFDIDLSGLDLCEDPKKSSANSLDQFIDCFQENLVKLGLAESISIGKDINYYRQNFKKFLISSLEARKKALLLLLSENLPKGEHYQKEFKDALERAKGEFSILTEPYKICGEKCKSCLLTCWLFANHDGDCDCKTDHKCHKLCEGCKIEEICGKEGGHAGPHFCTKKQHLCEHKCKYDERSCKHPINHDPKLEHICAESHHCPVKCNMENCKGTCKFDVTVEHTEHICIHAELGCLSHCIICDRKCASPDHYHNVRKETEEVKMPFGTAKVHLCEQTHPCTSKCEMDGICKADFAPPEAKVWSNGAVKFPYDYFKPIIQTLQCKIVIPVGKISHEGKHNCLSVHTCKERCVECQSFCNGEFGHSGKHSANLHRNKENSFFVSEAKDAKIAITGKDGRMYNVGESSSPEECCTSCIRSQDRTISRAIFQHQATN